MKGYHGHPSAFFALVLGIALLTKGVLFADPPMDPCTTQTCEQKVYFISSPTLECWSFEKAECSWCWQGRCTTTGPVMPWCNATAKQIVHNPWDGTCQPKCNLNFKSYSESTPPMGKILPGGFVFEHVCSEMPPTP